MYSNLCKATTTNCKKLLKRKCCFSNASWRSFYLPEFHYFPPSYRRREEIRIVGDSKSLLLLLLLAPLVLFFSCKAMPSHGNTEDYLIMPTIMYLDACTANEKLPWCRPLSPCHLKFQAWPFLKNLTRVENALLIPKLLSPPLILFS